MRKPNTHPKTQEQPKSSKRRFKLFEVRTVASIFLFMFAVRLAIAVVNNLIQEWCKEVRVV